MKSIRKMLPLALVLIAAAAMAQSDAQKPMNHSEAGNPAAAPKTEAQVSFDILKSLAGEWEGVVTLNPPMPQMSGDTAQLHVTMRVTSRGHAIVHELQQANTPLDATKYDHPVTMIYLNDDQLNLVHYCDAGNRPHMVARTSPDGKTVEFDFADLSGSNRHGHMHHGKFTYIDADHHVEDWVYMLPGDKPMQAHMDLRRTKDGSPVASK